MSMWKDVATLVKTRNLKGRFVARPAAGLPFLLEAGMNVAFVPPQTDMPREGIVDYVLEIDGGTFEVGFDTVRDERTARGIVGCHCLVERDGLSGLPIASDASSSDLQGYRLVDEGRETIGNVTGLVDNPAHPLLEVDLAKGQGSALVPLVDEFIVDIDERQRTITVSLPAGLLEL